MALLCLVGCSRQNEPPPNISCPIPNIIAYIPSTIEKDDVSEAAFRYAMKNDDKHSIFLSFLHDDPSDTFLSRFNNKKIIVYKYYVLEESREKLVYI